jgi:Tfp pilus assembly protein PilX
MNPWLILGFVLAVAAAGGAGMYQGREFGMASVQQKWDRERAAQEAEYAMAQEEARAKEQALQANADAIRQEKDREIRNLNARATALSNSLRDRPERPTTVASTVSGSTNTGPSGCTPRELYRQDSEVVVGLAREADEIRLALKQCYAQYEALRK